MPRPRKPTALLEQSGSFEKHPERRREREGEAVNLNPLGPAPAHLNAAQRVAWAELERITPTGVLTEADRPFLEMTCMLLALLRDLGATMETSKIARLESCRGRLGLTPADRSRVKALPIAKGNTFASLGRRPA